MRIKITLLRGTLGPVDLAVTVDTVATVGDVARRLADAGSPDGGPGAPGARAGDLTLRVHVPGGEDGRLLSPTLPAGEAVRSGSVVSIARGGHPPARGVADPPAVGTPARATAGTGPVAFNRSPRLAPVFAEEEVEAPTPPDPPKAAKLPVVVLVVPMVMAPVLLATGRSAVSLVFLALMPLVVIGNYVDQRLTNRRTHRSAVEQFGRNLVAVRADLARRREREQEMRLAEHPAVADLTEACLALEPLLWTRRPEHESFGELRLGTGSVPSRTRLVLPARGSSAAEHREQLLRLREDFADVAGVPVTVRLRDCGALGLAGPRHLLDGVARAQVAQLVITHSPAEVVLALVTSAAGAARWDWTTWLPHVGSEHSPLKGPHTGADRTDVLGLVSHLEDLVAERTARGTPCLPLVVLLVEDDAPVDRGRLVRLAEQGPDAGVHVVWCAASLERLPAACRTYVALTTDAGEGVTGFVRRGTAVRPTSCETLDEAGALRVAKHLSAVVDAGVPVVGGGELPEQVSYLSLVGADVARGAGVVERWRENGSLADGRRQRRPDAGLRALVGVDAAGPVALDLRAQGPHALVGGTTGAGKSELLQSWVLGMAATYSPARVTFLLVDYKGGAAFADCVHLPHTVGLVTDLTPHLVRRALTSLRAELRHRERLLSTKGAKDLATLERAGDAEAPPSLVVVVDEFAALATDVPEFVDGIVDVAQRGRSLGLHVVLATQRPAGVVTENLRANTNLRIALRMADETDSVDVLGVPVAAHIDPATPGRGAVRTGPGRVEVFQAAHAGGRTAETRAEPVVDVETLTLGTGTRWERPGSAAAGEAPTDLARVVAAVRAAADLAGLPAPRRPWLPTLAPVQDLRALGAHPDTALAFGTVDDPAHQRQVTAHFHPDHDGNLAVYGAGGAGKSTALRTLATAAGIAGGGPVHVYGLDFSSGGLAPLAGLPHVGAVVDGADAERVQRLLRMLRATVDERSARFAAARAGTLEDYRRLSGRLREPRFLLLLDGFAAFRSAWEIAPGRAATYQLFVQLLTDGRAVGVHTVVTADRPGDLPAAVAGALPRRVVLRQTEEAAYRALGAPADVLDPTSVPGRAITDDGLELQIAVPGGSADLADQVVAIEALAAGLRRAGRAPAPPVRRMPEHVSPRDMPRHVDGLPVLGIADDTLAPVGFAPTGTFLLAGPARSGRTNALRWIVRSVRRADPRTRLVYLGARRSALPALPVWERAATGTADVAEAAAELVGRLEASAERPVVLVVENLPDFLAGPAERRLTELVQQATRNGHLVVADGDTAAWAAPWPLLAEVRGGRRGMVLQPGPGDGDTLFRTTFPRVQRPEFPPGRGLVVERGTVTRVQLPLVEVAHDEGPGPPSGVDGRPGPRWLTAGADQEVTAT